MYWQDSQHFHEYKGCQGKPDWWYLRVLMPHQLTESFPEMLEYFILVLHNTWEAWPGLDIFEILLVLYEELPIILMHKNWYSFMLINFSNLIYVKTTCGVHSIRKCKYAASLVLSRAGLASLDENHKLFEVSIFFRYFLFLFNPHPSVITL